MCYELFAKAEQRVAAEKLQLMEQLRQLVDTEQLPLRIEDLSQHEAAIELLKKLHGNLLRAPGLASMLSGYCSLVLEPLQVARLCMFSYPYVPDSFACLDIIVESGPTQNSS